MDLSALNGGVAVLTGSASGLGLAMAKECLNHGMHVVISDVRKEPLAASVQLLRRATTGSCRIEGFICDVASLESVEALLIQVKEAFVGVPIQFVAANAGVLFPASTVLTGLAKEWETTYRVNVLGVQHTLRTFVPVLMAQPQKSIVEVTASAAGVSFGGSGPYGTSKLAVLGIAEALWIELKSIQPSPLDQISVVVLCPAIVKTDLLESTGLNARGVSREGDVASANIAAFFDSVWDSGMPADFCAAEVFRHAAEGKFYCILDNSMERDRFKMNLDVIIEDRFKAMRSRDLSAHRTFRGQFAAGEEKSRETSKL